jgi:hypothetical protein
MHQIESFRHKKRISYFMGSDQSYTSRDENAHTKSYDQQYAYQTAEKDNYGQTVYDRYSPSYAYENPTGRDNYGNPTYGDDQ